MKNILIFVFIVACLICLIAIIDKRDSKLLESMIKYEQCVKNKYGVSMHDFISEDKELPYCYEN